MLSVEPESRGTKIQIPWLKPPVCSSQQCSQGIQFSSAIHSCLTFCNTMDGSTLGFPVHHQLPKLAQTHVHWVSDAIQPSHPLSSPSFPAFNLSQHHGLFQWVSSSHQVAKVLEFQFSVSPSNGCSGLISFRMGWFDLLGVQGTLKSLLEHHSSRVFLNTIVQKHQLLSTQFSL